MATQTITRLLDDIDGTDAAETVEFALEGTNYTIDLNDKNATKLRKALTPFTNAATSIRTGRIKPRTGRGTRPEDTRAGRARIRQWANDNGHEIGDRGRIPNDILEAFHAARYTR